MRTLICLFISLSSFFLHATEVTLKSNSIAGKSSYFLSLGKFATENSALQFKFKIAASIKYPIEILRSDNNAEYYVKIGPFNDLILAQQVQNQLKFSPNNTITEEAVKPITTPLVIDSAVPPPIDSTPIQSKPALFIKADSPNPPRKLWNLRNADIRAVIAEVSRLTGSNFLLDPRVQGKISIISGTPISDKELYQVFLSMLQVSGYAAISSGDVIKIVPNIDAKTQFNDQLSQLKNSPRGDDVLVEVIPVHYVPAEQLVPVLRPLMPQWSNISAYAPSNQLILSGRANNIRQLAQIIKQVDTSSANGIDIVPLRHALAMDVAATLKELIKIQPGRANPPQLAADDRSNAILLSGSKTDRIRLRLLILKLDRQNSNGSDSNTQVVYLSYLRAEDLVPILAGIAQANFSGTVGTTIGTITRPALDSTNPASNFASAALTNAPDMAPSLAVANATPGQTNGLNTQNEGTTKPSVQIIAEPNTNSVILNAPANIIHILKSVINQLDIKPAQLLIEALVAEVDENDLCNLGIEWGSNLQAKQGGNDFRPGFAIINTKTGVDDFQAQIYALARKRRADILSTPSVVVLDNRQAKILVGQQLSVATTTYPNNGNGTAPASPYVTYDRVNVALHLYVRPQITRDNGIQLQIDQGNDTLDPASTVNNNNPVFKISSIVTAVQVKSGDIVVLGGLTQDSVGKESNRIPILGDIPGLGRLFQRRGNNREKRVLMVFIRPIILKNPRETLKITGNKYTRLRHYQLNWLREQNYNDNNPKSGLPPLTPTHLPKPLTHPMPMK